MAAIP